VTIGQTLTEIRIEMGFKSARGFYQFLSDRKKLDFNYSYYMRIEKNKVIPSNLIIRQLNSLLGKQNAERLTLVYCVTQFPEMQHIFKKQEYPVVTQKAEVKEPTKSKTAISTLIGQKFLSLYQISLITKTKNHYYLFLLITLARIPLEKSIVEKLFSSDEMPSILKDLEVAKIIVLSGDKIHSFSKELKFSPADSENLKKLYKALDIWDSEFNTTFNLNRLLHKVLIRRVSPRFIELIVNHCGLLLDLTRASEETDSSHNDEILTLTLSLSHGGLPG